MSLCLYCRTVPSRIFSTRRNEQGYHDHYTNLEDLNASAESGCPLCKLFVHSLDVYKGAYAEKDMDYPGKKRDRYRLESSKFGSQSLLFGYQKVGYFRGGCMPEEWRKGAYICHENASLTCVPGDEQPPPAASAETKKLEYEANLITRWAKLCFEKHTKCDHEAGYLPTRIIDVGTAIDPQLRLVASKDIQTTDRRYLALSHCWGLNMPESAKTIESNLQDHFRAVLYDDLPLTFRDFIDIARRLEVRYVWIDSLCILQDSKEDWQNEAAQMADVYSKSYLTIAASGSANGQEGCHVHPDKRSYGPVDVNCSYTTSDGTVSSAPYRIWARDPNPITSVLQNNPLNKRGWTVQERELPPRVVHYSQDSIRWECCELAATLEFPCGDGLAFDAGRLFDGGSEARAPQFGTPHNNSKKLTSATKQTLAWFELIQRYTERSLTKQFDILSAMSGIARMIATRTSDRYIAGLWESSLAQCLLWTHSNQQGFANAQHTRPYPWLAPTWSWASIKGPLEYSKNINGAWHCFNEEPNAEYLPKLVDVNLESTGPDPYGALSGGSITIQGKVRGAFTTRVAGNGNGKLFAVGPQTSPIDIGWLWRDIGLCEGCNPVGTVEMFFLMCCMDQAKDKDGKTPTIALVLKPHTADMVFGLNFLRAMQNDVQGMLQSFERVGLAVWIDSSFWDTASTMTLTLV